MSWCQFIQNGAGLRRFPAMFYPERSIKMIYCLISCRTFRDSVINRFHFSVRLFCNGSQMTEALITFRRLLWSLKKLTVPENLIALTKKRSKMMHLKKCILSGCLNCSLKTRLEKEVRSQNWVGYVTVHLIKLKFTVTDRDRLLTRKKGYASFLANGCREFKTIMPVLWHFHLSVDKKTTVATTTNQNKVLKHRH